MKLGMYIR